MLEDGDGEQVLAKSNRMPLDAEQMKVLISHIQMSVTESDQHNPALGLIKAILTRRFMSPEFYDLMETLLKLVVRSHNAALRQVRYSYMEIKRMILAESVLTIFALTNSKAQQYLFDTFSITQWEKIGSKNTSSRLLPI